MEVGLNTNVIMLTEAEKSPVSLKPLWLQLTSVVKLRKRFLLLLTICVGISFVWLVFLLALHKNHLRKSSKPEDNFFHIGSNFWNFRVMKGHNKLFSVLNLFRWAWGSESDSIGGGGYSYWLHLGQLLTPAIKSMQIGTFCCRPHTENKRHIYLQPSSQLCQIFFSPSRVWFDCDLTWLGSWVFPNETRVFSDDFAAAVSERAGLPLFEYQSSV